MSALPVTTPAPDRRAAGDTSTPGTVRIVTTPTPAAPRNPLAPTSPMQAIRRRIAVAMTLAVVLTLALLLGGQLVAGSPDGGPAGAAAEATSGSADAVAVVQPGDTVWSIAERHAPAGESTGVYAGRIVERNALDGGTVREWQVLRLP